MASRNFEKFTNFFKGRNVLWRMRAMDKTGVTPAGWEFAACTAVPPNTKRANITKKQVKRIVLPTDRLMKTFERRNPQSKEELTRLVDGRLVTRSWLFVQKQYELMREGRDEREAYQLAEQAVLEEERNALERLKKETKEAREMGALPAMSTLKEGDERWEKYRFWRVQLAASSYADWPLGKQASLDHWMVRELLGWEQSQVRHLAKEEFRETLEVVRELVFGDVEAARREEQGLSEDELYSMKQHDARRRLRQFEEAMVEQRTGAWPAEQLAQLQQWLEANFDVVLDGVEDPHPGPDGSAYAQERLKARCKVMQYMAFPLLRPEFQASPYLSPWLTRAFLSVAKREAVGLRAVLTGPLGKRTADLPAADSELNDLLPKLVVKIYAMVCLERPFAWELLRIALRDMVSACPPEALQSLPELRGFEASEQMVEFVNERWQALTEALKELADEDTPGTLNEDIARAYQSINELHRVAEELLHVRGAGHAVDKEVQGQIDRFHGIIEEDLALGLALRAHDKTVWAMFRTPAKHLRRQITALLRRDNKALAQKQEDVTLMARETTREEWERWARLEDDPSTDWGEQFQALHPGFSDYDYDHHLAILGKEEPGLFERKLERFKAVPENQQLLDIEEEESREPSRRDVNSSGRGGGYDEEDGRRPPVRRGGRADEEGRRSSSRRGGSGDVEGRRPAVRRGDTWEDGGGRPAGRRAGFVDEEGDVQGAKQERDEGRDKRSRRGYLDDKQDD